LVDPLFELHLLGSGIPSFTTSYVVIRMMDFTCLKGMVQDSVLVFSMIGEDDEVYEPPKRLSYDLLASPEDLAYTWSVFLA